MAKEIAVIGYEIPWFSDLKMSFRSKKSLADADIVLFCPELPNYQLSRSGMYQGKMSYWDSWSFELKADMDHWKGELQGALASGKNVFIMLNSKDDFFVDSWGRQQSWTGRNSQTTVLVEPCDNYRCLPVNPVWVRRANGKVIKPCNDPLARSFYARFWDSLEYKVTFDDTEKLTPLFTTKDTSRVVWGMCKFGKWSIIFLPYLSYDADEFTEEWTDDDAADFWSEKGVAFWEGLISSIVEMDKALSQVSDKGIVPEWAYASDFKLKDEIKKEAEITKKTSMLQKIEQEKIKLEAELSDITGIKWLLFETGKPLENVVTTVLQLLWYQAENYDDGVLELDHVIISPEWHRYIGECEWKDNSPISIDKFRQLTESMSADFARDEVGEKALWLLFGNNERLKLPNERWDAFTAKCKTWAARDKIGLIRTSDLFVLARYIMEKDDDAFRVACRKAIHDGLGGVIVFPEIPE